jgi:hypothetical protein
MMPMMIIIRIKGVQLTAMVGIMPLGFRPERP